MRTTFGGVELPLAGIRVVDMTSVVMGPMATQLLADLGADVIAIEDRRGDTNRAMGPGPHPELSGVTLNLMRNKRSIGVDVRTEAGYEIVRRLVAVGDVFVTNLRPGSRQRLRITYDDIRAIRPDIVYCAAAGYPPGSPHEDAPAYDDIIQAATGVPDLFTQVDLPPVLMPTIVADKVSGLVIANAVVTGLFHRARTGEGTERIVAMTEAMRSFVLVEHGSAAVPEPPLGGPGYSRVLNAERRPQRTADGWIDVLPYERHHYEALFRLGGRDDLIDDPRLESRTTRLAHASELFAIVSDILRNRTTEEWMAVVDDAGIPAARLATLDDQLADLPIVEHPHGGSYRVTPAMTGQPATPDLVRRPAPLHAEHNHEVLTELGYTPDDIAALEHAGVLYQGL